MENAPERVGEVASIEKVREVLGKMAQEFEATLANRASSAQIKTLNRIITQ